MGINRKVGIIFLFFLGSVTCFSQNLDVGVGLGNVLKKRELERNKTHVYLHLNYDLSTQFNVGLYFNAGGDFLIPFGEAERVSGDTTFLFSESVGFNSLFATTSYSLVKRLKITLMVGLLTQRFFIHADNNTKLRNFRLGYGAKVEYTLHERVPISLHFQSGGKSPGFTGPRDGQTLIMEGDRLPMLFFTVGYRFSLKKSGKD